MDNDDVLLEQPDVGLIVEDGNGSPDRLTEFEKLFPLTRAPKVFFLSHTSEHRNGVITHILLKT